MTPHRVVPTSIVEDKHPFFLFPKIESQRPI